MRYQFAVLLLITPLVVAAEPKEPEWVKVTETGQFRVYFPGKPEESSNPPNTKDPKKASQRFMWAASKDLLFVVSYLDLSGKPTPKNLEMKVLGGIRDSNAKYLKGEVVKDEILERNGLSGRQFTLTIPPGNRYRSVVFLKNDRLFQAFVIGSEKEVGGKDVDRFLKSFEVLMGKEDKK